MKDYLIKDYEDMIDREIKREAKRIFRKLYDLYKTDDKTDLSFNGLVEKYMDPRFSLLKLEVLNETIKNIPTHLYICPDNTKIFVTNNELQEIENQKITEKINNDKMLLDSISKEVAEKILLINEDMDGLTILDVISETVNEKEGKSIDLINEGKYLIENINLKLIDRGKKLISIDPIKIAEYK